MKGGIKTTIMVLALVGALLFAYVTFFSSPEDQAIPEGDALAQSQVGEDVINLLAQLKALQLDSSLFGSKSFMTLVDYTQTIKTEPIGRNNPFAPIGKDGLFIPTIALDTLATSTKPQNTATTSSSGTSTGSVPVKSTTTVKP